MQTQIEFTRVNNDVNGNPRYVCHYSNLIDNEDRENIRKVFAWGFVDKEYELAIGRANRIGGRKFHNKQYGGGIVFQSYNIEQTERDILELINQYSFSQ